MALSGRRFFFVVGPKKGSPPESGHSGGGSYSFDLVGELVVKELVEEDLGDDFELIAIVMACCWNSRVVMREMAGL
jgi:hypothetical protein